MPAHRHNRSEQDAQQEQLGRVVAQRLDHEYEPREQDQREGESAVEAPHLGVEPREAGAPDLPPVRACAPRLSRLVGRHLRDRGRDEVGEGLALQILEDAS